MAQPPPPSEPTGPQPWPPPGTQPWPQASPQPGLPWIKRNAVLAVILAGSLGLVVGAGIGAAAHTTTVTQVKTNTVYQTVAPADTSTPTPTPTPTPTQSGPDMLAVGQPETLQDTNSGATIGTLTVKSAQVTTQSVDGSGNTPVNGYFVVVHVSAAADSSYRPGDWQNGAKPVRWTGGARRRHLPP